MSNKKMIVNNLYQATVISILAISYLMLGKKILKMTPPAFRSLTQERHGKAGCHNRCVRDDMGIPHETENPTGSH